MERKYLKRYIDEDLERYLKMIGAVLIVGSKWCGKSIRIIHYFYEFPYKTNYPYPLKNCLKTKISLSIHS